MTAPACTLVGCSRPTWDASRRCLPHRSFDAPKKTVGLWGRLPADDTPWIPEGFEALGTEYGFLDGVLVLGVAPGPERTAVRGKRYVSSGSVDAIRYFERGTWPRVVGRVDGPALITAAGTNRVLESYLLAGVPHRADGGPTTALRDASGRYLEQRWENRDSRLHRLDGPAHRSFDEDENVVGELYARDGRLSAIDGPARIYLHGEDVREEWWLDGCSFSSADDLYTAAKALRRYEIRKHFTGTEFERIPTGREFEVIAALLAGANTITEIEVELGIPVSEAPESNPESDDLPAPRIPG